MRIERRFTKEGQSAYADIEFRKATSEIRNPDGSIVFRLADIDVPVQFSQVAADILAQKYFRKAGVPARLKKVEENSVPSWLWRSVADERLSRSFPKTSATARKPMPARCSTGSPAPGPIGAGRAATSPPKKMPAPSWTSCAYMLATQRVAPNSPQWFNTGLHWAYGIDGPGQGHFYVDPFTGKLTKSKSSYEHPQPHACFIQSVEDDLVNENGIMDLWVRERACSNTARAPAPTSRILRGEGEKLSGGGKSSGLMSFLKIGDRAAGAIKSGGTTRRAAKMVVVDIDHPDIEDYINWKVKEEQKVAALVTGSKIVAGI
jgi:ribonucleoside-diphosphate reductase alpha chain